MLGGFVLGGAWGRIVRVGQYRLIPIEVFGEQRIFWGEALDQEITSILGLVDNNHDTVVVIA